MRDKKVLFMDVFIENFDTDNIAEHQNVVTKKDTVLRASILTAVFFYVFIVILRPLRLFVSLNIAMTRLCFHYVTFGLTFDDGIVSQLEELSFFPDSIYRFIKSCVRGLNIFEFILACNGN